MKVSELIELLQQTQQKYGDLEIRLYDKMSYWYYPIKSAKLALTKRHPDGVDVLCPINDEWIGSAQTIFDKQSVQKILYLSTRE